MNESALPDLDAAPPSPVVWIERDAGTPVVALDPDAPFEALRDGLRALLGERGDAADLRGHAIQLDLGARDLVLFDLRRLTNLLREELDLTTSGVRCTPEALHRYAEQSLKLRVHLIESTPSLESDSSSDSPSSDSPSSDSPASDVVSAVSIDSTPLPDDGAGDAPDGGAPGGVVSSEAASASATHAADDAAADPAAVDDVAPAASPAPVSATAPSAMATEPDTVADARVFAVHRTLRSGARVRHSGDVVVYGDVNAGAQVEADGHIVVLGALRGLAHAGARGDESAVILSFDLRPTQIRIGNRIAFPPERATPQGSKLLTLLQRDRPATRSYTPEIARIEDGAIVLEDYRGRLPGSAR